MVEIMLAVAAAHSEYAARQKGHLQAMSWREGVGFGLAILVLIVVVVGLSLRG